METEALATTMEFVTEMATMEVWSSGAQTTAYETEVTSDDSTDQPLTLLPLTTDSTPSSKLEPFTDPWIHSETESEPTTEPQTPSGTTFKPTTDTPTHSGAETESTTEPQAHSGTTFEPTTDTPAHSGTESETTEPQAHSGTTFEATTAHSGTESETTESQAHSGTNFESTTFEPTTETPAHSGTESETTEPWSGANPEPTEATIKPEANSGTNTPFQSTPLADDTTATTATPKSESTEVSEATTPPINPPVNATEPPTAYQCGGKVTAAAGSGSLHSENWPQTYPTNVFCEWIITSPDPELGIELSFHRDPFGLAGRMPSCQKDWVRIHAVGADGVIGRMYGPFCSFDVPPVIRMASSRVRIQFHAGPKHGSARKGFKVQYQAVEMCCPSPPPLDTEGKPEEDSFGGSS